MLQVRVVSPPGLTDRLASRLAADTGVLNLVVLAGAARHPAGDAIQFDLLDGSANAVLSQLRELHLDFHGPVVINAVDAALADRRTRAPWHGLLHREVAPVWEMVEARIRADATYAPSFYVLLVIAALIGAVGILTNSQILIVGAMVVGPEYNAIISVALGIDKRDRALVRTGMLALISGFLFAIVVTLVFALGIRWSGRAPELFLHGVRPVSDLINSPNLFSAVVAVLAGVVGVVSLTESRANALIGVFISVTTIPAAADIAVSLAFGSWHEAGGSALQLLLNVGLLIAVGAMALHVQRRIWRNRARPATSPS
jgi:uncharacterized hydrophobic protein (TIGR00271 family)